MKATYNSPRLNGQHFYCSFPFALDTFQGCSHNCKYCFSYFNYLLNCSTKGHDFFDRANTIDFKHLEKAFGEEQEKENKLVKTIRGLIKLRAPIHWGGVSDPFSAFEKQNPVSLKVLKLFEKHQYPVIISTKSDWIWENEEYINAIANNKNLVLQVSLISLNPELKKIEPAVGIEGRLKLIEKVSKTNRVVIRMQPLIPKFCEENIEHFVKEMKRLGASAITAEFLKISQFSTKEVVKAIGELSESVGFDIVKFYKWKGVNTGTDLELKVNYKKPVLENIKKLCHENGLEFYCADNILRDLGDSPICCGIPENYPGFENYFRSNSSKALFIAKEKGEVKFKDVYENMRPHEEQFNSELISPWLNLGTTEGHMRFEEKTFLDRSKFIWDNPKHNNNPARFFENLKIKGLDEDGHIIYEYKK
jgi:DNA repair photolyase